MSFFYDFSDTRASLNTIALIEFLESRGIAKYINADDSCLLVKVSGRKVRMLSERDIITYIFSYVTVYPFENEIHRTVVHKALSKDVSLIMKSLGHWLKETKLSFIKDTSDSSFFFFRNCIVKVTKDTITKYRYSEIEGHIWETDIKDHLFLMDQPYHELDPKGDFHRFINYVSSGIMGVENIFSVLGYCLHRYKDPSFPKAVIFYDSNVQDPNVSKLAQIDGGSGKSLLCDACGKIRRMVKENGKSGDMLKTFFLSRITNETRLLFVDDVKK